MSDDITEMQLDLTADEIVVIAMLANMGSSMLAGDMDAVRELGGMLIKSAGAEKSALSALNKLESAVKLMRGISQEMRGRA